MVIDVWRALTPPLLAPLCLFGLFYLPKPISCVWSVYLFRHWMQYYQTIYFTFLEFTSTVYCKRLRKLIIWEEYKCCLVEINQTVLREKCKNSVNGHLILIPCHMCSFKDIIITLFAHCLQLSKLYFKVLKVTYNNRCIIVRRAGGVLCQNRHAWQEKILQSVF